MQMSRTTDIIADAQRNSYEGRLECTGNFFIDEEVLTEEGVTDFAKYAVNSHREINEGFVFVDSPARVLSYLLPGRGWV